jgi:hypothetical protein
MAKFLEGINFVDIVIILVVQGRFSEALLRKI